MSCDPQAAYKVALDKAEMLVRSREGCVAAAVALTLDGTISSSAMIDYWTPLLARARYELKYLQENKPE